MYNRIINYIFAFIFAFFFVGCGLVTSPPVNINPIPINNPVPVPHSYGISPQGQGLYIVNSVGDITSPVNGKTWAFIPGPPAQLWAYYSNTWNNTAGGLPGGTPGQLQFNNTGVFGGFTPNTDCTVITSTGKFTCTSFNGGTSFGTLAGLGVGSNLTLNSGNLTTNGVPSGVINVSDIAYGAKGDGVTDDSTAIQSAVAASCTGITGSNPTIYLPTPSACYFITKPIALDCNVRFVGAGWNNTAICQNFSGPSLIIQPIDSGWKPPLTTSITATWIASHSYGTRNEIIDSNGNVEVATTSGTSGSGSHPIWPVTVGNTTSDGTVTWTLAMIGTSLLTGSGGSLDGVLPGFFPGAGGNNNAPTEISWASGLDGALNGLSQFTIEATINPLVLHQSNENQFIVMLSGEPENGNTAAFKITSDASSTVHWAASADIGGSNKSITSSTVITPASIHHVALTYNGATLTLWVDGVSAGTAAATGNLTVPLYESLVLDGQGVSNWPVANNPEDHYIYIDSFRISNTARYTTTFTPPTAKFVSDSNTVYLQNFVTSPTTGTLEAFANNTTNVFIPILTTEGANLLSNAYIGGLELAPNSLGSVVANGIWANWTLNSIFENFRCSKTGKSCLFLAFEDYQDIVRNAEAIYTPNGNVATAGYIVGWPTNEYDNLQSDGSTTDVDFIGGYGVAHDLKYTDRGTSAVVFPVVGGGSMTFDEANPDIEDSSTNFKECFYSQGSFKPVILIGSSCSSAANGGAYLAIKGGAPFLGYGTDFSNTAAEVLNVISNSTSPSMLNNPNFITGSIPLTNSGKSYWLYVNSSGQDNGMVFADLPSCAAGLNGTLRFLTDGTIGATCAGSGTGAWAKCIGTTWVCD